MSITARGNTNLPGEALYGSASQTLSCWYMKDGALVAPASAVAAVFKPGGATTAITATACTIASTYRMDLVLDISSTDDWALGESYWVRYTPTVSAVVQDPINMLFDVVYLKMLPNIPITVDDLKGADPSVDLMLSQSGFSAIQYVEQAWVDVYRWIKSKGERPYLIADRSVLYSVTRARALYLMNVGNIKIPNDRATALAERYAKEYEVAQAQTVLQKVSVGARDAVPVRGFQQPELGTGPDRSAAGGRDPGRLISTYRVGLGGRW